MALAALFLGSVFFAPTMTAKHPSSRSVAPNAAGWMAKRANPKHPWLYVAGFSASEIEIYDLAEFGPPLIGTITQGILHPDGIALDSRGTLYVANQDGGTVTIYPAGSTTPSLTLTQDLDHPTALAVDASGNVYVGNRSSTSPGVVIYPPGSTTPSAFITSSLIQNPICAFVDAAQIFYISDAQTGVVAKMPAGSQQLTSLGLKGLTYAEGIALDPLNGRLFVTNLSNGFETYAYSLGKTHAKYELDGGNIGADYMTLGKVDRTEYLFLSNTYSNEITVYVHNSKTPFGMLATASSDIQGLAFKAAGMP